MSLICLLKSHHTSRIIDISSLCINFYKSIKVRVNLLSEVLTGIRVVKMNTWERPFLAKLEEKRTNELYHLRAKLL